MMLDGDLREGDSLPSVRQVASDLRVNPLTVLKSYQQLADEQLIEKRRGLGMFIRPGARELLLQDERERFLNSEWPRIVETIQRLGLDTKVLLSTANNKPQGSPKR
jgi:GntR family transcriptional regulator